MNSKTRNCSIDIFKYICAWLVIAIHEKPFLELGKTANYLSINILPRIAVPFFLVVSGYFLFSTINKNKFSSYIKKIIITYSLWSIIYISYELLKEIKDKSFDISLFKQYLVNFFVSGTAGHLWYIPALIYCSIIIYLFNKARIDKILFPLSILVYIIGCFGSAYRNIGNNIPVLNSLFGISHYSELQRILIFGFSFISLGYSINKLNINPNKPRNITSIILPIIFIMFIAEKLMLFNYNNEADQLLTALLFPLITAIFLFLIQHPSPKLQASSKYFRNGATFVYFSHLLFIDIIGFAVKNHILLYICVGISATIVSFVITKINNKYLNLLNG